MDRAYPFIKSTSNGDKRALSTPNDYHRYARWCVKSQFSPEIRAPSFPATTDLTWTRRF